jgi:hypothetical protein
VQVEAKWRFGDLRRSMELGGGASIVSGPFFIGYCFNSEWSFLHRWSFTSHIAGVCPSQLLVAAGLIVAAAFHHHHNVGCRAGQGVDEGKGLPDGMNE